MGATRWIAGLHRQPLRLPPAALGLRPHTSQRATKPPPKQRAATPPPAPATTANPASVLASLQSAPKPSVRNAASVKAAASRTPSGPVGAGGSSKRSKRNWNPARVALVQQREAEIRLIIATGLGVPVASLRIPASFTTKLAAESLPASIAAKLTVLLAEFSADPLERALVERAIRANPWAVLRLNAAAVVRKLRELAALLQLAPPPPAAKGGGGAAAGATAGRAATLQVLAREPGLLGFRASSLDAKITELCRLLRRDRDFVLAMACARPRLLVAASSARHAAKVQMLNAAAARVPRWQAELSGAGPGRLGSVLVVSLDTLARLTYLADKGWILTRLGAGPTTR